MATNLINSIKYPSSNTAVITLPYGVCSTPADTAAKTVTVDNFVLEAGAAILVKFSNKNSASSPTLSVNSSTAKPIVRYGTTAASTSDATSGWRAGAVLLLIYDGTSWVRQFWENTTYSNASLGQGYATCSTAAATVAKTASLSSYSLSTGGIVSVKFTYDVPASATLNINSKGAKSIYYKGAAIPAGIIKAGDVATFIYSSQYHLISIDTALETAKSYTDTKIAALVNGAPETLNTIDEIAAALNDNADILDTLQTKITGAATTVTGSNLTASRALVSNSSGKIAVSAVTSTELGYLDGVTSAIQTQLNAKVPTSRTINGKDLSSNITLYTVSSTAPSDTTVLWLKPI